MSNEYIDPSIAVQKLTKDLAASSRQMSSTEARFLVDYYYICQDDRIRFNGQIRAMTESGESNLVIQWLADNAKVLEDQVKKALDRYTEDHPIGSWIRAQHGFGPVLAAGFLAHIDIERAPTAGHIWSYAGLNPNVKWEKGQKRPWNAELKKLCFKAGDVQIKFSTNEDNFYGKIFAERKKYEWEKNLRGEYLKATFNVDLDDEEAHDVAQEHESVDEVEAAIDRIAKHQEDKSYSRSTESWAWVNGCYKSEDIFKMIQAGQSLAAENIKKLKGKPGTGTRMLPPAHIQARARRYCIKIFLSHLHEVWYETHFQRRVPNPFVLEHMGHVHRIQVPGYSSPYAKDVPSKPFKINRMNPEI